MASTTVTKSTLLEEVLKLAQSIEATLNALQITTQTESVKKTMALAPQMDEQGLQELKRSLEAVEKPLKAELESRMEILKKAGSAYSEWQADSARATLETQETPSHNADLSIANQLLSNL
jgi:hypothetical protein